MASLVATLGGDSVVKSFHDTRFGVTATSTVSQWDDARGSSGYGPSFSTITGTAPTWNSGPLLISASGAGSFATPASALYDLSGGMTLVLVGICGLTVGIYWGSIADATTRTRQLAVKDIGGVNGSMGGAWFTGGAEQTKFSNVDAAASPNRCAIVKCSGTTGTIHVPNQLAQTTAITAEGSGSNRLTLFDYFPGGGSVSDNVGSLRAVLVIGKATTNADDTAILTWAQAYHNVVAG